MTENEVRELIRDFLNGEYSEEEIALKFDLAQCEDCENYELEEDLHDTAYGIKCESCLNDIDW